MMPSRGWGGLHSPKAGFPSWGRCWCVSPCPCLPPQASSHLPQSPEPGIHWNPRALRSPAVRHPAAAQDTGWVAGRSSNSGWAAGSSLETSKEPRGRDVREKSARMRRVPARGALWGDRPRPGPSSSPGGGPGGCAVAGPARVPDLRSTPAATWPRSLRAGSLWLPSPRPRQPPSGRCGGPAAGVARRGGKDTGLRPVALPRWSGRPPRGGHPPPPPRQIPESPGPLRHPGGS